MSAFALPLDYAPMEAKLVDAIPESGAWQYEPKWDGFRALAFRDGPDVELQSKSGQPLARYFPEVVANLAALSAGRFVLDGELVVPNNDALSFDDLLMRIHPAASRVQKLAASIPATYVVFDLLAQDGKVLVDLALSERRTFLENFGRANFTGPSIRLSPATRDRAQVEGWYRRVGGALDGVVAKRSDAPYGSGNRDVMVKVKALRTADCVVGGYRIAAGGGAIGSLLLGLYDDGVLDHVGFTSGFSSDERAKLLKRLEPLHAEASFERRIPGGPSRWNRGKSEAWQPLRPELVLEVRYDQVSALRFRHGTRPLRWRPDKAPLSCTIEQIKPADRTLRLFD